MTAVFGEQLNIEIYGTSHGPCVGVKLSGVPSGLTFDMQKLQAFLNRRAPGRNEWSTQRKEADRPRFLSGVKPCGENAYITDGTVIEAVIDNTNVRPQDYGRAPIPRPAHADYPAWVKYGVIESGGGAFSARLTAPLCVAGGICLQLLESKGVHIRAHIASIGETEDAVMTESFASGELPAPCAEFPVIDEAAGDEMKQLIAVVKEKGDSIGGVIECMITGLPAGIGEPVFGSMESRICQAVFAVPAVKGIEFGAGFGASRMKGSENNDPYLVRSGRVITETNNHGGILGGLSSGMPVLFRAAMKPTPSIAQEQDSVDLDRMEPVKLTVKGRHDPCIVPRAVPCLEAAAAVAVFDMFLEEHLFTDVGEADLNTYRRKIDRIDADLAELLEKRFDVVGKVGRYKERKGLPVLDASREQEKINGLEGLCTSEKAPYVAETLKAVMAESRHYQEEHRLEYGLLGRKLGHSFSPQTHKLIGGYEYGLFEREPEQLDSFFQEGTFKGISVTMPYKRDVMKYCSELSERAKACNSVNTIIRRPDGSYYGDNTDYYGFESTILASGINISGMKAIVLGSGGVSGTVVRVLKDLGAEPVTVISRTGEDNYENLDRHFDARIVVNTTPVGMYPHAGEAAIDITQFTACEAVFDLIYNPLRTKLMIDAESAGIPAFGGLHMLAAQAAKACGLFLGEEINLTEKTHLACGRIRQETENIVLIGMPGCGKTTIGRKLARLTGKQFTDCDEAIADLYGRTPEEIILKEGVDRFREMESEVIRRIMRRGPQPDGSTPGIVFATGGGCVERDENRVPLLENSFVVYVDRPASELDTAGRPLSQKEGNEAVLARRRGTYEGWSDARVDSGVNAAELILQIMEERKQ